jgi:hypothetical protein
MIHVLQRLFKHYLRIYLSRPATKWGDELYTERTQVSAIEENAKKEVDYLDVAYWPEGNALCLFYGSTSISKDGQIGIFTCKHGGKNIV